MIIASLFSGCGGLDYGFEKAGYSVCFFNDSDKHSCATLRMNGKINIIEAPIEEVSADSCKKMAGTGKRSVDLIIGGPPCQPFSKSSYWSKGDTLRMKDRRADTLDHYFRFVEELLPKVFLLENVHGLNYNGKEEGFQYILKRIAEVNTRHGVNYVPSWAILSVADYGIPQLRVRFFLVAERNGRQFKIPKPTHGPKEEKQKKIFVDDKRESHVSSWEAIGEIEEDESQDLEVRGKWAELLPSIPEGENYLWHTDRKQGLPLFGWRTRYWGFLLKLAKSQPSWTIQAQPGPAIGPFHWKNRRLSWQEMAAIQTFPKEFKISGTRVEIQRQLGNAVPSLMAEILAREIGEQYFERKYAYPPSLSIPRKKGIPSAERVMPVPEKYKYLMGKHSPHPGTGKGPRANKSK